MIALADTLTADRIGLALEAPDHHAAIRIVADLLRGAEDVLDWEELAESLRGACPCLAESGGSFAICLPHARTDSVHAMVMSAGRFDAGIAFPGCALPVRYIFCIGVPKAMENDYLRILGLLLTPPFVVHEIGVQLRERDHLQPAESIPSQGPASAMNLVHQSAMHNSNGCVMPAPAQASPLLNGVN